MTPKILFVSVEASGDDMAVDVIRLIREKSSDIVIDAIGGPALRNVGINPKIDVSAMNVVGGMDVILLYSKAVKLADEIASYAIDNAFTSVVLIDSWGLSFRIAQRLKNRSPSIKVLKLIGPQVWATRPGRAKLLASCTDHLLCIHEFEVPFYESLGLPCTVIGNPAIRRMEKGNGLAFREQHKVQPDEKVLLVLPGSRRSELRRVASKFAPATRKLRETYGKSLRIFVLVSPTIENDPTWKKLNWADGTELLRNTENKADVMSGADVALACSGTVTTELAAQGCPMVIAYKLGWVTWAIYRVMLMKSDFIALVNIALGREAVAEVIQTELTAERLVREVRSLFDDPVKRKKQIQDLALAAQNMGRDNPPAPVIAANKIFELATQ